MVLGCNILDVLFAEGLEGACPWDRSCPPRNVSRDIGFFFGGAGHLTRSDWDGKSPGHCDPIEPEGLNSKRCFRQWGTFKEEQVGQAGRKGIPKGRGAWPSAATVVTASSHSCGTRGDCSLAKPKGEACKLSCRIGYIPGTCSVHHGGKRFNLLIAQILPGVLLTDEGRR